MTPREAVAVLREWLTSPTFAGGETEAARVLIDYVEEVHEACVLAGRGLDEPSDLAALYDEEREG
jgi:hypothetical protein